VTSAARAAANRRNAARSSGPRSALGKQRSARNALRHGLSVPQLRDADSAGKLEALTDAVRAATGAPRQVAALIAEARLELLRARQATVETLNAALRAQAETSGASCDSDTRLGLAVAAKVHLLAAFVRYERRAWSRLKKLMTLLEKTGDVRSSIATETRSTPAKSESAP
jgi:hypothetical protein